MIISFTTKACKNSQQHKIPSLGVTIQAPEEILKSKSSRERAKLTKCWSAPRLNMLAVGSQYTKEQVQNIEKIQRRGARFVSNDNQQTSSVTEMLIALDWPTLEARREAARLTTLYKIDSGDVKIKSANLQPAPSRSRRTHDNQYTRLQCHKDIRLNSFFPRTIKQWNSLPQQSVSAPSADGFHQRVLRAAC